MARVPHEDAAKGFRHAEGLGWGTEAFSVVSVRRDRHVGHQVDEGRRTLAAGVFGGVC